MLATVRNRRGVVSAVEPFESDDGRLHLVHVEYQDAHGPAEERLLWELEPKRDLLEPTALPDTHAPPMPPEDFDALLRAARWTALSPYLDPDGDGPLRRQPIASPFHGSVRVEDYQLVPLLKALRMPRVSLLIADDVGLGKTVEAGLILTELLLRRRIQRILVLTPASLRQQWRDELWDKFSLRFEIVDREGTERLRRRLGMDANPWRSFSRIVASYHYLRQPDVREGFLAACHTPEGSPHLPWDLLIVDECHNLMPSPFGEDSELCRTLRLVAPLFEHRLFLSATPHNGHTRSFTGLLEMLDPVRFSRVNEMNEAMRGRVEDIVVRRLKRDINAQTTDRANTPTPPSARRFCVRKPPVGLPLSAHDRETELAAAFDAFREAVRGAIATGSKGRRRAGAFAVEVLGKRLLSCPVAFAQSWRRTKQGLSESAASESALTAAERALRQETGDDRETQQREATAATVTGAWLKNFAEDLTHEIARIESALADLGFDLDGLPVTEQTPAVDARFEALVRLIERLLLDSNAFRDDERLIVFTEYKTTLDYLARRLRERYPSERVLTLFGAGSGSLAPGQPLGTLAAGMSEADRENVKAAFNHQSAAVRILVATDAASEGLNLHRTARYLLHYDCPWNPSRLEQRNGRLDRYGQPRDVVVHHFVSMSDPDMRFLDHVIHKANEIREDLGSLNEVFDRAVHRRLVRGEDRQAVQADLDAGIDASRGTTVLDADAAVVPADESPRDAPALDALARELDLDGGALAETLEAAMATNGGRPQLQAADEAGCHRVLHPDLPGWRDVIDDAVRPPMPGEAAGPMPKLAFDPEPFIEQLGDLHVFLPRQDTLLVHLAHPMMLRALGVLNRRRYPGHHQVSRWTVRTGGVPPGEDALVLFSVEELAVNELRETFHRWIRTFAFPVRDERLGAPLPHDQTQRHLRLAGTTAPGNGEAARDLIDIVKRDLERWLRDYKTRLDGGLRAQLQADQRAARAREDERYRQRQGEVSVLIERSTLARLTREIEQLAAKRRQGQLFDQGERFAELEQSIERKQEEVERRRRHYEEIREQLRHERTRILDRLLPARFKLAAVQAFPVTVEVRVPEGNG